MIKLRISEEQLSDIVKEVLNELNLQQVIHEKMVIGELVNKNILVEGLIKTYGINDTIKVLENTGIRKYGVKPRKLPHSINKQQIYKINLFFENGLNNIDDNKVKEIIHFLDTCGWYMAIVIFADGTKINELTEEKINEIRNKKSAFNMIFEAKFEILVDIDNLPEKLYHVTPTKNTEKILKKGLSPKNRNKVSFHPERIYLFTSENLKDIDGIIDNFKNLEGCDEPYSLLEIDVDTCSNKTSFMYDSNCEFLSFFTLEPISPYSIKHLKTI